MPPAGGIWPSKSFYTLRLLRYVTRWDYFILALEIVFCFLTVYYLFEEVQEVGVQNAVIHLLLGCKIDFYL